jgi:hypothetical protein
LPDGVKPEISGWTIQNKDILINQQSNQERDVFTKGQNILAVSDPDAIDDFVDIDPDLYTGFLMTPEFSLDGVAPNSIALEFDSSFRPYPTMIGLVDVSFDGGDNWENLLTLDTDSIEGGESSLVRADETVMLDVSNPSGGTIQFRWGMTNAGNDWWWAIDNVRVAARFTGNPLPGIADSDVWNFSTVTDGIVLPGDLDGDGEVQFSDFVILANAFGTTVDPPGSGADIDGDGEVQFSDFVILANNFGQSIDEAALLRAAPQPSSVDVLFARAPVGAEASDDFWD